MEFTTTFLKGGQELLMDTRDEHLLAEREWRIDAHGYLASGFGRATVRLHQLILPAPAGCVVDHRNGNRLDNRRSNLRVSTKMENGQNRGKPRTTARVASQYKGVSWDKCNGKWRAKIVIAGKQRHLGYFSNEVAAARAYDVAAEEHFGKFARLNFPFQLPKLGPD